MSCDIVQHPFADKLLKKVNILTTFFRNNARAGAKFWELLNTMNIKGGVIMLYCKTRWMTAYKSIDDVLRAANYSDLLTNDKIKPIICLWNFFNELKVLGFVLNLLYKTVLALERKEADLKFCNYCIEKINACFNEFDDNDYLLAFFLNPLFQAEPLKQGIWIKSFNQPYTEGIDNPIKWWSSIELEPPYLQQLAIHLFSVYPNSASYEYEFSICGWLLNKRSNASYKLAFYEKDVKKILQKFSNNELNNIINETLAEQPKLAEENDNEIALEKN
ncbi:hypothetical protein RhiirA1_461267 [Rhizophagus irregularis]|uniref:HAT C-terminal dimerisation domain-containing protein n=1 Tax=Rhizophagus irregularis TaxID=588596 RepID=A0A2N0RPP2_9GLOM|nr:hypothetical protein RhiirA1_461267 [Rhizophagus irregularis]